MQCRKVLSLLPRFIENDFTDEESGEISAHLEGCDRCKLEWQAMVNLLESLENCPVVEVPASFKEAVMKHLPQGVPGGKGGGER